jgi:hypothetical protein
MVEFTAFPSIFDNKTHRRFSFDDWEKFTSALFNMSRKPGYKPKKGERSHLKPSPLITPAVFEKGTTRANTNVIKWAGWCALDIEDVESDQIKHFWYALNKEFNSIGDPQTKDLSRMYYIPAQYPNAFNFCFSNKGKNLNPKELMNKYEYVDNSGSFLSKLPIEMQKQILQHRKDSLTNDDYEWNSYHDCKFVHKKLVEEYRGITETGWYHKMYQIMISIAGSAIKYKYPITASEISILCRQIDLETGGWYKNRPIEKEAQRALEYVLHSEL